MNAPTGMAAGDREPAFGPGDPVERRRESDYRFPGWVIGVFRKRSGRLLYAVEDDRGVVHIMGERDLVPRGE